MKKLLIAGTVGMAAIAAGAQAAVSVSSPNNQLTITLDTLGAPAAGAAVAPADTGRLVYSVTYHNKPLIEASALHLEAIGSEKQLGDNVHIASSQPGKLDESYPLLGKASKVTATCNTLTVNLEEPADARRGIAIEIRAYDDGVAFRYVVPALRTAASMFISRENTEFRIAKDATAWAQILPNFRSMYESEYVKLPVSAMANQGGIPSTMLVGCPMLMEVPGVGWLAISEGDLKGNPAMYLTNPSGAWTGHWLQARLAPDLDNPYIAIKADLPWHSAWRVLQVADEPAKMLESNIITNLNPPSLIQDTSWIKPGKASWDWWSGSLDKDGKPAYTTENMKYYVDFAAAAGLEYMLIDSGWFVRKDVTKMNGRVDIPAVCEYAKSKNVRVWIWSGYSDLTVQMEQAFPLYEQWGVAGVKTDFIERDDAQGIDFYYRCASTAARHHLMMDFHGACKPWGIERTWPNVLGYEAVLGMEQSKAGARDNPDHRVTLPFTRMLCGLMDYTPGGFDNVTRENFQPKMDHTQVLGTRTQQLAMYVVFDAPVQMVADHPGAYKDQPAFNFIKACPTAWDETRGLQGYPGEYIAVARRRGNEWFLGAMTNTSPRKLTIPLSFLSAGPFTAEIYADAHDADANPKNVAITTQNVTSATQLEASLAPGGGYAVRFKPNP